MTTTIKKAWNFYINTTNGFIPLGYQLKDINRHLEPVDLTGNSDKLASGEHLTDDDEDEDTVNDELLFDAQESIMNEIKSPRRRPVEKIWTTIIENRRNEDGVEFTSNDTMEEILPGVHIKLSDGFGEETLVAGNNEEGDSNASNILDDLKFNDAVSLVNIVIKLLNEKENKINSKEDLNNFKKIYFKSIIGLINSINLESTKWELMKQIIDNFEIKSDLIFKGDDIIPMINKNNQYDVDLDGDDDEDEDETRAELYAKIRHNLVKFERVDYAEFYSGPIDRISINDVSGFTDPDSEDSMYDSNNDIITLGVANDNSSQGSRYPFTRSYEDPFEDDFIVNKDNFQPNGEIMLHRKYNQNGITFSKNDYGNVSFLNKHDDLLPNEKLYKIVRVSLSLSIDMLIKTIKLSLKLIEIFKPIFQIIFIEIINLNEKYQILNSLFNFFVSFILQIIMFLKEGINEEEGIGSVIFSKLSQLNRKVGSNSEFFESEKTGTINENEYPKNKTHSNKTKLKDSHGGRKKRSKPRSNHFHSKNRTHSHFKSEKENKGSNEENSKETPDAYNHKPKEWHDTYNVHPSMYNSAGTRSGKNNLFSVNNNNHNNSSRRSSSSNSRINNNNNKNNTYSKKLLNFTIRKAGEYLLQSQFNDINSDKNGNSGYYY
ncbi:unnamed protein product [[Candida] boidinii]|uniref:Unnamed protein product n=1 Tax=Candida boidinii TaxID=5477 RepID=A0A9W6WDS8_CANBO|nr:hypothetical protein B5S30_g2451 [[Candida] boidinii]OWB85030.1 hypothetical protein B5S33_g3687 [[Candida] boidinii]GME66784.1 unnamed protein product [[Candida] boidinii]